MFIALASRLTDSELLGAVTRLAHSERQATVALIVHLAEFEARRLYAAEGFSSAFKYCVEVLRLSEDAAFNRLEAARAARAFPSIVGMLEDGRLSPTTAQMLRQSLTPENQQELLAAAAGKSKREVQELLASWFPQADKRTSLRRVATPVAFPSADPTPSSPDDGPP